MKVDVDARNEPTAVYEWRTRLAAVAAVFLLFTGATGLAVYFLPFGRLAQFSVILHTAAGLLLLAPTAWYLTRHWWVRRRGNLSHFQLLGYVALGLLATCVVSGLVVTWQGVVGPRMSPVWDSIHLATGIGLAVFTAVHVLMVAFRRVNNPEVLAALGQARRLYAVRAGVGTALLLALSVGAAAYRGRESVERRFPVDYNWRFGEDRPFAPSMARLDLGDWSGNVQKAVLDAVDPDHRDRFLKAIHEPKADPVGLFQRVRACAESVGLDADRRGSIEAILQGAAGTMKQSGAIAARSLANSKSCGTAGCHRQIYEEWLPSAHRYASMDDMFQRVQALMARETSPEHTRYCAGCHDPISLFSGAKNSGNITLSSLGADEGVSCLVCHSIVQSDVQGNGDYTILVPERYAFEEGDGAAAKFVSDFLIRTYPQHHVRSYSRSLYKTAEFCGACHKQYIDKDVNTDIGKVQGQNQYDSWKNSRWHHPEEPGQTVSCRECHLPLVASHDPARGDAIDVNRSAADGFHRSHRTLGGNQYIPRVHDLPNHDEHIALTEKWLRGEIEVPEIADRWTKGAVVNMSVQAPKSVAPGESFAVQVQLQNNKTGHDFPTGPLDMIESWIEIKVEDQDGRVLYHTGAMGADGKVIEPQVWFKAEGFDRRRQLIDRHNLWDLVGARYKRSLFPGVTDSVQVPLTCPSMARERVSDGKPGQRSETFDVSLPPDSKGELTVTTVLWYRKANPDFLNRVYGIDAGIRSPITELNRATTRIEVRTHGSTAAE